jgi:hypothetical protein
MSDSPRRYVANSGGLRVLVGLSIEETREFESLDRFGESFDDSMRESSNPLRWQQLYQKHEHAWQTWKTKMTLIAGG